MTIAHGSHHQWGNVGYYLSALLRFGNLVGFTRVAANPDSWEGWYWGAMHHWGQSQRVGIAGNYGLVEDCLREAELMVFWSSDPESTRGGYAGHEGTERRQWARELGMQFVHIDPHYNPTAAWLGGRWIPIRPGTDAALAMAIMQVWVAEDLYDHDYVAARTTGFEEWRDHLMGVDDGVPKTPEWQETETGVPAKDVRALARLMARKKLYLAAGAAGGGFGGAGRGATGAQWARCMVMLMAMRGLGKPGINMGNLEAGTPVDHEFYFPGYADGGISGELQWNGNAVHNYQKMPHVITVNPVRQLVPKQQFPDAIVERQGHGLSLGRPRDGDPVRAIRVPDAGLLAHPHDLQVRRLVVQHAHRIGTHGRGLSAREHRVRRQPVDLDGRRGAVRRRHPARLHPVRALRHRRMVLGRRLPAALLQPGQPPRDRAAAQVHRAARRIEVRLPDLHRHPFAPGARRDVHRRLQRARLVQARVRRLRRRQAHLVGRVLPQGLLRGAARAGGVARTDAVPLVRGGPAEGHLRGIAAALAVVRAPSAWACRRPAASWSSCPRRCKRNDPSNPERPVLNRYIPSWEGPRCAERAGEFPLQLVATHSRYSFHTNVDGKGSAINEIEDHRVRIDGHAYWLLRIHSADAAERGIVHHGLVKVFNDRGAVICAADVSSMVTRGRRQVVRIERGVHPGRGRRRDGGHRRLHEHPDVVAHGDEGNEQHGAERLPRAGGAVEGGARAGHEGTGRDHSGVTRWPSGT